MPKTIDFSKLKRKFINGEPWYVNHRLEKRCKRCHQATYWGIKGEELGWKLLTHTVDGYVPHQCFKHENVKEYEARKRERKERRQELRALREQRDEDTGLSEGQQRRRR